VSGTRGSDPERIHVAVGVIQASDGRVLIAQRSASSHQGGYWEFPGGKVEPGEAAVDALARELFEETGIRLAASEPLIRVPYDYSDKRVLLDVYRVRPNEAQARARLGQAIRWVRPEQLTEFAFPAANRAIIAATMLPAHYVVSPDMTNPDDPAWWAGLDAALKAGARLFQYRVSAIGDKPAHAAATVRRIHAAGGQCLINADARLAYDVGADGVHWPARLIDAVAQGSAPGWQAASCHGPAELERAATAGVDFAVLGPVARTASHPSTPPIGWPRFAEWVRDKPLPVYAIGGLAISDDATARWHGGQGVAGISGLWSD